MRFDNLRRLQASDWLTLPTLCGWRWCGGHFILDWLPWALAGATIPLTQLDALPAGDMKGLAALALWDVRLYLAA